VNELQLIESLTRSLPTNKSVIVGAGDDCAVLDVGMASEWLLFKTDSVVEGVHFLKDAIPEKVGRKAIARCLSDIAAMAGTPSAALVTLGLPENYDLAFVTQLYAGMSGIAQDYDVAIVGGETVPNPGAIFISIAMTGAVPKDRCVRRAGAQPGDAIFVTGELGGSIAGRHFDFEPRVREAQWLASRFAIHAMIDLSDGLSSDLPHILRASGLGAELLAASVPISRAARQRAREENGAKKPLAAALTDGEDFELLFTVGSKDAVALLDGFKGAFPKLRLTCIGKVVPEAGVRIRDKQSVRPLTSHGYIHFEKS
jgi:thiamine-monophosphate kinase